MVKWTCRALLPFLILTSTAHAQVKGPRVGAKVVLKYARPLRVDDRIVDDGATFRVYTVDRVEVGNLWLVAGGVRVRVPTTDIIPFAEAVKFYSDQIRDHPDRCAAYISRGLCRRENGELDAAIADYTEAIYLEPQNAVAYDDRGLAWRFKNNLDRAIADYNEAIRLDREYETAFYNRGNAWLLKKDYARALADYDEAIRLEPRLANGYNNRAWVRATCPDPKFRDGKKAVESAKKACELSSWKVPNDLGTLAAAYAEAGDFDQAVKAAKDAIKLTPSDSRDRKGREERLVLYSTRKPYHEH